MTIQTIMVQTWSSIFCMVIKELTGWETMEPSSSRRTTWIIPLLKHGKLSNYHPQQSPRKLSRIQKYSLLPRVQSHKPPSLACSYSDIQRSESGWCRINSEGHNCAYRYGINQDNWPNGNPERNLLLREAAHDTVRTRTVLPIQEIKTAKKKMNRWRMMCITKTPGENDAYRNNLESSSGIYMTLVKED